MYLKSGSTTKMPHRGFKLANVDHIGEKKVCVPKIGFREKMPHRGFKLANLKHIGEKQFVYLKSGLAENAPMYFKLIRGNNQKK